MAFAVGIDLGTTNTVVAAVRDGIAVTLPDAQGDRLLPSVVSMTPSGSVIVGRAALERRVGDAENTVYSVKRLIGRLWAAAEVQRARETLPFRLEEGPKGSTLVTFGGDTFSLSEISAFVLRQAKAIAEAALGSPVERAVITVPANFNDLQRAATKTAGRLAGLEVLRILNEPTAAALAYGPQGSAKERVAVYDLGGGTFDVTVLDLVGNVFEVLATAGDTALGGDDIDLVVADRMADDLLKRHRFDARETPTARSRLRILAEETKRELSAKSEHEVSSDDFALGRDGSTWRFRMTRSELESASLTLIDRTLDVCRQALEAAGATAAEIDRVILVGGSTRMPMVGRKVEQFFGRAPVVKINPDEVVALGAAIQAELLDRSRSRTAGPAVHPQISRESVLRPLLSEDTPGAELPDAPNLPVVLPKRPAPPKPEAGPPVAPPVFARGAAPQVRAPPPPPPTAAAPLPAASILDPPSAAGKTQFLPGRSARSLVFDVPEPKVLPPFEIELEMPPRMRKPPVLAPPTPPVAFAASAAKPAAPALPTRTAAPASAAEAPGASPSLRPRKAPLLIDVTPLSLNVETVGGYCDVLIDANTPVPCDRTRSFATASDGQTSVCVRVAQGESRRFNDNTFLGEIELSGVRAAPRGEAPIAVTFEIDADGILNVRARDVTTGRETVAKIQLAGAQTAPAEIQAMRDRQAKHPLAGPR